MPQKNKKTKQEKEAVLGNVAFRFKELIHVVANGSISDFANMVDFEQPTISNIVGGRLNNPSLPLLAAIFLRFPNINPDWVIYGKGDMFRRSQSETPIAVAYLSLEDRLRLDKAIGLLEQVVVPDTNK